ncbi:MAG: DUF423 domain-containing protein [Flavobacteriales bacterium]|nr:DUF423 domain-containing protein [Flavobacteriales bacterium]
MRNWIIAAASSGALAVVLGALGAHALKELLPEAQMAGFETAVRYQVYHTFAVLLTVVLARQFNVSLLLPLWLFAFGTLLFSGSIYVLATLPLHHIEELRILGPVTPIGGMLLISGWLSLAFAFVRKVKD